jgi:hypothetical protein
MPSRLTVVLVSLLLAKLAVIFWFWVVIQPTRLTLQRPVKCWCDPGGYHVDCSISPLNSIPLIFPTNVRKLLLDNNSITSLEKDRFIASKLTEWGEIYVNDCEMETVNLRAFCGLRKLAILSMCGNKLREITLLTVQMMNRLVYLVFVDNITEHLGVDLLWGLVNWKYFYFTKINTCCAVLSIQTRSYDSPNSEPYQYISIPAIK